MRKAFLTGLAICFLGASMAFLMGTTGAHASTVQPSGTLGTSCVIANTAGDTQLTASTSSGTTFKMKCNWSAFDVTRPIAQDRPEMRPFATCLGTSPGTCTTSATPGELYMQEYPSPRDGAVSGGRMCNVTGWTVVAAPSGNSGEWSWRCSATSYVYGSGTPSFDKLTFSWGPVGGPYAVLGAGITMACGYYDSSIAFASRTSWLGKCSTVSNAGFAAATPQWFMGSTVGLNWCAAASFGTDARTTITNASIFGTGQYVPVQIDSIVSPFPLPLGPIYLSYKFFNESGQSVAPSQTWTLSLGSTGIGPFYGSFLVPAGVGAGWTPKQIEVTCTYTDPSTSVVTTYILRSDGTNVHPPARPCDVWKTLATNYMPVTWPQFPFNPSLYPAKVNIRMPAPGNVTYPAGNLGIASLKLVDYSTTPKTSTSITVINETSTGASRAFPILIGESVVVTLPSYNVMLDKDLTAIECTDQLGGTYIWLAGNPQAAVNAANANAAASASAQDAGARFSACMDDIPSMSLTSPSTWVRGIAAMGRCLFEFVFVPTQDALDLLKTNATEATTKAPISYLAQGATFMYGAFTGAPAAIAAHQADDFEVFHGMDITSRGIHAVLPAGRVDFATLGSSLTTPRTWLGYGWWLTTVFLFWAMTKRLIRA